MPASPANRIQKVIADAAASLRAHAPIAALPRRAGHWPRGAARRQARARRPADARVTTMRSVLGAPQVMFAMG
eukprot:4326174-Pyramimonas_sp.AAC.1